MHFDAEFYVAVGFLIFVLILAYQGVHTKLTKALDDRAHRVANELAQAKKLHDEAAAVLDTFRRKAAAAEAEAASIVAQAKREAELMAKETEDRMAEFVLRRTKQAEAKIAMAETQATSDVRAAAADAAVKAAEIIFRRDPQGTGASDMVVSQIERLKARMH